MSNILVVEDNNNLRWLYQLEIKSMGYKVRGANNGEEASYVIKSEPVDLIILDIVMPNRDGTDLLEWLAENRYSIPVIIYTSHSKYKDHYLCCTVDRYLIKSSDVSELKNEINNVLESRAPVAQHPFY